MSEFNGKKYYGFSLRNDPALTTTTRNFEFRYSRPEQLERAIQKVQQGDDNFSKKKSTIINKYSKIKKSPRETFKSRDVDVETRLSRNDVDKIPPNVIDENERISKFDLALSKTRVLSQIEVEQLIGKAKNYVDYNDKTFDTEIRYGVRMDGGAETNPLNSYKIIGNNTGNIKPPAVDLEPDNSNVELKKDISIATIEQYCEPEAKWVEIIERPCGEKSVIDVLEPKVMEMDAQLQMTNDMNAFMSQFMPKDFEAMQNYNYNEVFEQQEQDNNPNAYYIEDSDLEYEMMGRPYYTKFCNPRPQEESTNLSNDDGGYAQFIEVDPNTSTADLKYLKNLAPIRYTDMTDDTMDESRGINMSDQFSKLPMKVYIKKSSGEDDFVAVESKPEEIKKSPIKDLKKKVVKHIKSNIAFSSAVKGSIKTTTTAGTTNTTTNNNNTVKPTTAKSAPKNSPHSPIRKVNIEKQSAPLHTPRTRKVNSSAASSPYNHGPDRPKHKKLSPTAKSIEELKLEKIALFNKMTSTQERIIESMDKLRLNLLEMYVPENTYEKHRRQKNAFEFSVRFSRNFLYPLKGMIEDLKVTSVELLNSAHNNEACQRVAAIYALILQSLQTYQKQLRYFLLDQVPQKLTTLIEMIYSATNICLEKSVFDKHDAIIECLRDRCSKFLGFLEDMHEERFLTARDNYRKLNFDKQHKNYDLKMFMNDLNMYEPKLVPKNTNVRPKRIRKNKKSSSTTPVDESSDMMLTKITEDTISTQVQEIVKVVGQSDSFVKTAVESEILTDNSSETTNKVNQVIIDALQMVTKEQVRQVLEPILQTLGTALDKKGLLN